MPLKTAVFILSLLSLSIALPSAYAEPTTATLSHQQKVTLDMQNMTCSLCQFTIKKALQNVAGVHQVSVAYDSKTATVIIDTQKTNSKALIEATTSSGYPATERKKNNKTKG